MLDEPEGLTTSSGPVRSVTEFPLFPCVLQVDMVCGDHLLDHYQSLKDIMKSVGKEALQVSAAETQ